MTGGIFSRAELTQVSRPAGRIPECGRCGLYKTCKTPKMPVAGQGRKGIMVIGEAPGETEDERGKPFVGKSGEELQAAVRLAGADLFRDCWVTNALSCRPPGNTIDDPKAIGYCRPLVNAALERYDPRVVLLVGKAPVVSVVEPLFGGIDALSRWVGQRIPHLSTNRWLCPTWHPAYLMREKKDAGWALFREHVRRAVQIKDRPRDYGDSQEDFDASAEACADPEEAARRLDALEHRWGVAFDFETTCLRPESRHADILCCSASDGKVSVAFPWVGKAKETMLQILRDPNVPKIAWNAKFEARWCRRVLGIDVKFAWDGMLGSHLLDPRTGTSGLDFQAFTKLGVANYWRHVAPYMSGNKAKEGANAANSLVRADREELLTYCAKDSLYEHALSTMQMKELRVKWPR